ncbi:hypothetical protein DFH09DRAFT_1470806 [Mycena vulgaris]|nr:hypothetical protein DFH09DRAFT_1470806 [Mycena vulgaris]
MTILEKKNLKKILTLWKLGHSLWPCELATFLVKLVTLFGLVQGHKLFVKSLMPAAPLASDTSTQKSARRAAQARIPELDIQLRALQFFLQVLINERSSCEALLDEFKYPLPNEITSEIFLSFPLPRTSPVGTLPRFSVSDLPDMAGFGAVHTGDVERNSPKPRLGQPAAAATACAEGLVGAFQKLLTLGRTAALPLSPTTNNCGICRGACSRWADMVLVLPLEELRLIQGDMPRLRKVTIGPSTAVAQHEEPVVLFDRAPNLTNMVLSPAFDPFAIVLPWSQLTTLEGYLFLCEIAEILRHTARLERCILTIARHSTLMDRITVPPLLHLGSLSFLSDEEGCESPIHLLDALALPGLKILQFNEQVFADEPENIDVIPTFVSFVSRMERLEELHVTSSRRRQAPGILP